MKLIKKIRERIEKQKSKNNSLEMNEEQLCDAIRSDDKSQTKLGRMLLRIKNVEETSLITVMKHFPFLRKKVWKRLLKKDPSKGNLLYIIREIPSLSEKAKEELEKRYPEIKKKGY